MRRVGSIHLVLDGTLVQVAAVFCNSLNGFEIRHMSFLFRRARSVAGVVRYLSPASPVADVLQRV